VINTTPKIVGYSKSLSEVIKNINIQKSSFEEIGESIEKVFYVKDYNGKLIHMNAHGWHWINKESSENEIDIDSYFDDGEIEPVNASLEPTEQNTNVINKLQKVWFPLDLEYKLCLISTYDCEDSCIKMHTLIPIKEWGYFQSRLTNLIEDEVFIANHRHQFDKLTKREEQIVKLISTGLSSKDISIELFISKHTVEQHRKNINKKLDVNSIAELVRYGRVFASY